VRTAPFFGGLIAVIAAIVLSMSSGHAAALNPRANLPLPTPPSTCVAAPDGAACEDVIISDLNSARLQLGLGIYNLPLAFTTLSGERQIFILTNLDRIAYGLAPITGLSPFLHGVAARGVHDNTDPTPRGALKAISQSWGSNWAGAFPNALIAYYAWMYADGFAGERTSNLDCNHPHALGCWGHRDNILAHYPQGILLSMGAAINPNPAGVLGYATIIVATAKSAAAQLTYSYTWAQEQASTLSARKAAAGDGLCAYHPCTRPHAHATTTPLHYS
jgi:hypothetical protein